MSKRRTHSSIDTLPAALRETLIRMVVDGDWPSNYPAAGTGKPTYDDLVAYAAHCGESVSRSAIGRWAKGLLTLERMRTAAGIARTVMQEVDDANATETQKAAAEMMTARIIEMAADESLKSKDIAMISGAIRDCAKVAQDADKYIRQQIEQKAKAAAASAGKKLKDAGVDRKKIQAIIDDILGITK